MQMTYLKRLLGRAAGALTPSLLGEVRAGDLYSGSSNRRRLKRWLSKDDIHRLTARNRDTDVEKMLTNRWTGTNLGTEYYDIHADRFESLFSGPHGVVLGWLEDLTARRQVSELIEVGCGDGRALEKVVKRGIRIDRLVGIDINQKIVARNREQLADLGAEFIVVDATSWLDANCRAGTLLMTIGGVMEYMSPLTLGKWFSALVSAGAAGVLLVEPISQDHDLEKTTESFSFGDEDTFSHNYPELLKRAGLEITECREAQASGARWLMILAEVPQKI